MAILANDKHSIGDLFNNRNPFVIPQHQRAYSWEKEEIESFCQDVREIQDEYFFGGIVSVHEHANNVAGRIFKVVDGQQRLVTFTILLILLKEAFEEVARFADLEEDSTTSETAKSLADEIYTTYVTYKNTRVKPPKRENRLTLSKVDRDYFIDLLNNDYKIETSVESHNRLRNARNLIFEELIRPVLEDKLITAEQKLDEFSILREKLLENSVVIHITCDDINEAYQLFEVLNDRGKELAIGDYLRSSTLELLENDFSRQEAASSYWDEILAKKNSEKYIKSYLTSHIAEIKRSNVHRQFQKAFFHTLNEDVENVIKTRIENLRDMYLVYESISEGVYPYPQPYKATSWQQSRLALVIKELDHKLCIPFLLAMFECTSEEDFIEAILSIEKFVFRYITISGLRANRLSEVYRRYIIKLRKGEKFSIDEFRKELKDILETHCNDKIFADSMETNLNYKKNAKTIKKIRYFLTTLEAYHFWYENHKLKNPYPTMSVQYNLDSIEIEHIFPQKPRNIEDIPEEYIHNIGNLSFWSPSDNKAATNNIFSEKRKYYAGSNIAITRELATNESWGKEEIENRKNYYVELALRIFSIK
ncbi:DUF262 domain-containing HNH endonuclease family protein [Paenibacillus pabuli]|uniref:DUF262 domain-containing protein n=1 Tax=Paenibacillus pabuli TaxID=1472 RepID=UPI00345AB44C